MLEIELAEDSLAMPLMNDFKSVPPEVRAQLIPKRDEFETMFSDLITALPLPADIDRKIFRLSLLTLLNTVNVWYRPGAMSPADIARQVLKIFRHPTN
jgi:hypothetical protein